MRYWLMKSEPDVFGVDDLARAAQDRRLVGCAQLSGAQLHARSDAARRPGFLLSLQLPGAGYRGHREVSRLAYPDATQFDPKSEYYDPAATPENPRWFNVDVTLVSKTRLLSIQELRAHPQLADMRVLQRGNRLSITPVEPREWEFILKLLDRPKAE